MHITVNKIKWKIEFTDDETLLWLNGYVRLGITDRNERTVYFSNALRGKLLQKVLLHELTHVWLFSYGYGFDVELEEMLCGFVDTFFVEIWDAVHSILQGDGSGEDAREPSVYKASENFSKIFAKRY